MEILKEGDAGVPIAEIVRKHGISRNTYFGWRRKYAGATVPDLKRLRELEAENAKLKRMYTDLALEVGTSIPSVRGIRLIEELVLLHGKPAALRVDNGPELTAEAFAEWCRAQEIDIRYIQPGKPDRLTWRLSSKVRTRRASTQRARERYCAAALHSSFMLRGPTRNAVNL